MTQEIPEGTPGEALDVAVHTDMDEGEVLRVTVTCGAFEAVTKIDTEVDGAMLLAQMLIPALPQIVGQGMLRYLEESEEDNTDG